MLISFGKQTAGNTGPWVGSSRGDWVYQWAEEFRRQQISNLGRPGERGSGVRCGGARFRGRGPGRQNFGKCCTSKLFPILHENVVHFSILG